ncbi:MAG: hypothetical protein Q4B70_13475 [Lachnospiraceae bacterium]|nr:hypothetical protein [Lachnospiraceae bacterium]
MFTVILAISFYRESIKRAALDRNEEWGCDFVRSDKNKLDRNTVMKDVSLT